MDSELLIGGVFRAKIRISFHLLGIGLRVRQKSALSRKGERAEGAYFMLLPDLLFSFGGLHRFLCDDESYTGHREDGKSYVRTNF